MARFASAMPPDGLAAAIRRLPGSVFAVLDGAWFDDLPASLAISGLPHRCLFRHEDDPEILQAGPWLVDPTKVEVRNGIDRVLGLVGNRPAMVFWSCPAGEDALFRHLRTLNEVLFPRRPPGEPGSSEEVWGDPDAQEFIRPAGLTHERLLFRHWDPRVLASVAPLLDAEQSARLLGPGQGVALDAGYGRGVSLVMRPEGLPAIPSGPLRFTREQIALLDEEYRERFRWNTVAYLQKHCGEELKDKVSNQIYRIALMAEKSAKDVDLYAGEDVRKWALLWVISDIIRNDPCVKRFMLDPAVGENPEKRFEILWEDTIQFLINKKNLSNI